MSVTAVAFLQKVDYLLILKKDKHRKGRPITETKHANIERVRAVIENDLWCIYDEIEAETPLSRGTIEAIIHEHLKMKK